MKSKLKQILLDNGGIKQTELAEAAGLTDDTISKIANGKKVSDTSLAKTCAGLGKLTDKIFKIDDIK